MLLEVERMDCCMSADGVTLDDDDYPNTASVTRVVVSQPELSAHAPHGTPGSGTLTWSPSLSNHGSFSISVIIIADTPS